MAANSDVDLHTRRKMLTQDFGHFTHRQAFRRRLTGNLSDHKLTVLCTISPFCRNQHFHRNTLVVWLQNTDTGFFKVATNDQLCIALQNFNDLTFRASSTIQAKNLYSDLVTMKDLTHLSVRQIHIITIIT